LPVRDRAGRVVLRVAADVPVGAGRALGRPRRDAHADARGQRAAGLRRRGAVPGLGHRRTVPGERDDRPRLHGLPHRDPEGCRADRRRRRAPAQLQPARARLLGVGLRRPDAQRRDHRPARPPDRLRGPRAAFAALALAPLAACLGLRRYPFAQRLPHTLPSAPGASPDAPGRLLDLVGTPELKRLYLSVVLLSSAWDVHQFLVPLYGARIGLSASKIGLVLSAFSLATFVVRLALPVISRRVAEWPLILAAMATSTIVYLLYPLFVSMPAMIALSFALGLGLGTAQPMMMVVLHHA